MFHGHVHAIHLAEKKKATPMEVDEVQAIADCGLEGDRFFKAKGLGDKSRDAVTLIEAETLEALKRDHGIDLAPGASRRNITTSGVPLNHLVGVRFQVGEAIFEGYELCEPCARLAKLTSPQVRKALVHRGGLRAYIRKSGTVRKGDTIRLVTDAQK